MFIVQTPVLWLPYQSIFHLFDLEIGKF